MSETGRRDANGESMTASDGANWRQDLWEASKPKRRQEVADIATGSRTPEYSRWRHGGWYTNVTYPSGACGCVSNNYKDKKWRIVCDERDPAPTFRSRDEATRAEAALVLAMWDKALGTQTTSLSPLKGTV